MANFRSRRAVLHALLLALALHFVQSASADPFTFQAYLEDGGVPINGTRNLELRLYSADLGGFQIGSTVFINNVQLENGLMNLQVDFQADIGALPEYWIEVVVDGDFLPRIPMLPAPLSSSTSRLLGNPIDAMAPMTGDVLKWNGSAWTPDLDNGQVYTPGNGIEISGGQIEVTVPYRLPQGCSNNDFARWNGSSWFCASGTGVTYTAGDGLLLIGNEFNVDFESNGLSDLAARADHSHYGDQFGGNSEFLGFQIGNSNTSPGSIALQAVQGGSDTGIAVRAVAQGDMATGLYAIGARYGVEGVTTATNGVGVRGNSLGTTGLTTGVSGVAVLSDLGIGVDGIGGSIGTRGISDPAHSVGVLGMNGATTGSGSGVRGFASAPGATGVSGINQAMSGTAVGVSGDASATPDGIGVNGNGGDIGVRGSGVNTGVHGSANAVGVLGSSATPTGIGVRGFAQAGIGSAVGVRGESASDSGIGVEGVANDATGNAIGVRGQSSAPAGIGVLGEASNTGVRGTTSGASGQAGVEGIATASTGQVRGVYGETASVEGAGLFGNANAASGTTFGVIGQSNSGTGHGVAGLALATNGINHGVLGRSNSGQGYAVLAENVAASGLGVALRAESDLADATVMEVRSTGNGSVWGIDSLVPGTGSLSYAIKAQVTDTAGSGTALYAQANGASQWAGRFVGKVDISGTLSKGGGSFKIDHPLDPENQYLYHSFVESPDMMNIYNGNVQTDANGVAVVTMPDWFEALNREFRYQLTVIGSWARAMVAEEIAGNQFVIRTNEPFTRVSWQVTGVRQDPWAEANRIPVEEKKAEHERGKYLHPEAWGVTADKSLNAGDGKGQAGAR